MTAAPSPAVLEAYAHCAGIARRSGSSFLAAFWMFPREQRRALHAIYAFCRLVDDIADDPAVHGDRGMLLERWHEELVDAYRGKARHPVGIALGDAVARFALPEECFLDLLAGIEADLCGGEFETFAELEHYCYCVASTIGLLVCGVRGLRGERVRDYAVHLGKKLGMTRIFDAASQSSIPVTVIEVSGNTCLQVKTVEKDGYSAVQVGYDDKKESRVDKPSLGHFKKHGATPKYKIQEFRFDAGQAAPETHTGIETFVVDQWVDVIGTTKGRGFQGAVKRHGFGGLKQTHGSMMHRRTGAIGCRSTPGRVWKNQKMPGHMGDVPRTIQNLKIVAVRPEDGVILVSGAVPGAKGGYLTIRASKKKVKNPIYTKPVADSKAKAK